MDSYGSIKNLQLEDWYQQFGHNDSGIWIGPGIGSQMLIRVNSLSYDDKKLDFVDMAFAVDDGNYNIHGEENDYSQASIPFAEVRQSPDG